MITANQARDLADNIETVAAKSLLSNLNQKIRDAAISGLFEIDITREPEVPCVISYLEHIGYRIEEVKDDRNYLVKRKLCW